MVLVEGPSTANFLRHPRTSPPIDPSPICLSFSQAGFCRGQCSPARPLGTAYRRFARRPMLLELPHLRKSHQIAHALESVALGGGQSSAVSVVTQMPIDALERSGGSEN